MCSLCKGYDSGGPSSKHTFNINRNGLIYAGLRRQKRNYLLPLHVADATVVRPGWLWSDALLTEGHRGNMNFVLQLKEMRT